MIVSLSSAAARNALAAFAIAAAVYLTYFSVRDARATYYTDLQTLYGYERATQLVPENAKNWYLLGRYLQYSLEDSDPQRAISSYQTSLEIDPTSTVTWLDLATTYELEGNDKAAQGRISSRQSKLSTIRRSFLALRKFPVAARRNGRSFFGDTAVRGG